MKRILPIFILFTFFGISGSAYASGLPAINVTESANGQSYSLSLQVMIFMTVLSVLPGLLMTMTSFTRIIIVLAMLRQGIGLGQTPTNQIMIGIALFMTIFIMQPVYQDVNSQAIEPFMADKISMEVALQKGSEPLKAFMLKQVRDNDLDFFVNLSGKQYEDESQVPFTVLMPAYLTSELKTAFQIGFLIFLPFLIIDIVVSSILMAMGMMMLSPLVISLPFKVLLFVLVDGWILLLGSLSSSFG